MKQNFVLLLMCMSIASTTIRCADSEALPVSSASDEATNRIKTFAYGHISGPEIIAEFKRTGYIAIAGVPGFADAYQRFLCTARQFTALSCEQQAECTPPDYSSKGWSRGVEVFNGKTDTYKGSYYAWLPDGLGRNIWPTSVPEFADAYKAVASIVLGVGQQILPLVGFSQDTQALARMLHYKSVPRGEDDGNSNWCGIHRDHGFLTGLCPEVFYKDGKVVSRPEGSGLYIEGKPVAPPFDVVLFQMGEVIELMTNGAVRATDHLVAKAHDGSERYAMAVFVDPIGEVNIKCTNPDVIRKYDDRYMPGGMTYTAWGRLSYAKYNPKELAPRAKTARAHMYEAG